MNAVLVVGVMTMQHVQTRLEAIPVHVRWALLEITHTVKV
jgi:hypothetical protein